MDNHDKSIKAWVCNLLKEELLKEIRDLRKDVNKIALQIGKLTTKEKTN